MTYTYHKKRNSPFPFGRRRKSKKKAPPSCNCNKPVIEAPCRHKKSSPLFNGALASILKPIEQRIGRKVDFDDILLVALIVLIMTNKEDDDLTLLICLGFILIG